MYVYLKDFTALQTINDQVLPGLVVPCHICHYHLINKVTLVTPTSSACNACQYSSGGAVLTIHISV